MECLIYWLIFAIITSFDRFLQLSLFFLPFYQCLKLFLLVVLLYPTLNLKKYISKDYFLTRMQSIIKIINVKSWKSIVKLMAKVEVKFCWEVHAKQKINQSSIIKLLIFSYQSFLNLLHYIQYFLFIFRQAYYLNTHR